MKKLSYVNCIRLSVGMAAFALVFGSSVAAETGQQQSLTQLSAQVEDLTWQLQTLQSQVEKQVASSQWSAFENIGAIQPKHARTGRGRNKSRSRQPFQ